MTCAFLFGSKLFHSIQCLHVGVVPSAWASSSRVACVGVDESEDATPLSTDVVPDPPHVGCCRKRTINTFRTPRSSCVSKIPMNTVSNGLASSVESIAHGIESSKVGRLVRLLVPTPIVFHKYNVPTCVFFRIQYFMSPRTRKTLACLVSVGSVNAEADSPVLQVCRQNGSYSNKRSLTCLLIALKTFPYQEEIFWDLAQFRQWCYSAGALANSHRCSEICNRPPPSRFLPLHLRPPAKLCHRNDISVCSKC